MHGYFNIWKSINIIRHKSQLKDFLLSSQQTHTQKNFNKILSTFTISVLENIGLHGTYLNTTKAFCEQSTVNFIPNGESLKWYHWSQEWSIPFQYSVQSTRWNHKAREGNKRIHVGKEVRLSLFADKLMLCFSNPKNTTREIVEIMNSFSSVAGCRIICKSI